MIINAEAYLEYEEENTFYGYEELNIVVKFREGRKLFKTKLAETLVTTFYVYNRHLAQLESNRILSIEDYYKEVEKWLNDTYLIKMKAEEMIKEYFNKKSKEEYENSKTKNIAKRVSKMGKFKFEVHIK